MKYYINKNKNDGFYNELHKEGCWKMPSIENREYIGFCSSNKEALQKAKDKGYISADGCAYCCPDIHRG